MKIIGKKCIAAENGGCFCDGSCMKDGFEMTGNWYEESNIIDSDTLYKISTRGWCDRVLLTTKNNSKIE